MKRHSAILVALLAINGAMPFVAKAAPPAIALTEIVSGLALPVEIATTGEADNRLYVVEQGGRIRIVENGAIRGRWTSSTRLRSSRPTTRSAGCSALRSIRTTRRTARSTFSIHAWPTAQSLSHGTAADHVIKIAIGFIEPLFEPG
jgi:hypothetical protein